MYRIVIDKRSVEDIVPDIDFKPKEFTKSSVTKIIDLKEIAGDEHFISVTVIKKVIVRDEPCQKKECIIVDTSSTIQVVLRGEHSDTEISKNKTHLFQDYQYKIMKYRNHLNSPKNLACTKVNSNKIQRNCYSRKYINLIRRQHEWQ